MNGVVVWVMVMLVVEAINCLLSVVGEILAYRRGFSALHLSPLLKDTQ